MLDDPSWQFYGVVAALGLMLSFLVGQAMDGIMRDQGFGALGNALVLASGFVLGLSAAGRFGYSAMGLDGRTVVGVAAAFAVLLLVAAIKRFVLRL